VWRHYEQSRQVGDTAERQANFVPQCPSGGGGRSVRASACEFARYDARLEQANIYARASGYVEKRYVDIGDRVKPGSSSPRSPHPKSITRSLSFRTACSNSRRQRSKMQPTARSPRSPWTRSGSRQSGWATQQQGDTDRYNYQAQQHATQAAGYNAAATQANWKLQTSRRSISRWSPFRRGSPPSETSNVGSLITADATSGTSMFSMVHSDVIRVWVYVPQDDAFG